jgi:hypothetical protein
MTLVVQKHINGEGPVVIGTFFLDDDIARDTETMRLGVLQEPALVVVVGRDDGPAADGVQDLALTKRRAAAKPPSR